MNPAACLLFLALPAAAHEGYPISPVRAIIRVEKDRTVADLRTDSIFWIEEVAGLHPMPAQNWPGEARARVEAYVNAHFRLSSGGGAWNGRLVEARYRQLPWEVNEEGVFFLRMEYPALPQGSTLTGAANFYEEYRREMAAEYRGRRMPHASDYRTLVDVPGRVRRRFTLAADSPSFAVPSEDARRATFATALEALERGALAALSSAAAFPSVLALALCLGTGPVGRAPSAVLLAAAAAGFLAGRAGVPPWTPWAATLGASLAAGRLERGALRILAAVAAAMLCAHWSSEAARLLPRSGLAVPAALLGTLASGAALFAAARLGVRAERRRLLEVSESRVDALFARRARLTATALAMVGAYGLWQSLRR